MRHIAAGLAVLGLLAAALGAAESFSDAFDKDLDAWQPLDAKNWELRTETVDGKDNSWLALKIAPKLRDGVRRPCEYTLVKDRKWRDETIELRGRSLRPTTLVGRDLVVIFGWQDDLHFYYAHLSNDSNNSTHNVIMKVQGDQPDPKQQRVAIQKEKKPQPRLSDGWHPIKLEHRQDGTIQVWMDDLVKPLMTATDTTYPSGMVGVGSFDDIAGFDDVKVTGELVK